MNKVVIAVLAVVAVLAIAFGVFSFVRAERYRIRVLQVPRSNKGLDRV